MMQDQEFYKGSEMMSSRYAMLPNARVHWGFSLQICSPGMLMRDLDVTSVVNG